MYFFTATQSHDLVLTTKVTLLIDRYMFILLLNVTSQEFIYMWMYEALVLTSFGRLWKAKHLMDLLQVIVKSLFAQCHPCIIIIKSLCGPNSKTTEVAGVIYGNFSPKNLQWNGKKIGASPRHVTSVCQHYYMNCIHTPCFDLHIDS